MVKLGLKAYHACASKNKCVGIGKRLKADGQKKLVDYIAQNSNKLSRVQGAVMRAPPRRASKKKKSKISKKAARALAQDPELTSLIRRAMPRRRSSRIRMQAAR